RCVVQMVKAHPSVVKHGEVTLNCDDGGLSVLRDVFVVSSPRMADLLGEGSTSVKVSGSTKEEWLLVISQLYPIVPRPEMSLQQLQQVLPVVHKHNFPELLQFVETRLVTQLSNSWSLDPSAPGYIIKWLVTAEQLQLDALKQAALKGLEKQPAQGIRTQMATKVLDADLLHLSLELMLEAWKVTAEKLACPSCMQHCNCDSYSKNQYSRGSMCSACAFLEALNAAHHPLALYPPQQIRTDSFSRAFFDYLRAINRLLSMPSLLQQRSDLQAQLFRGAFSDCPICALVPGVPQDGYEHCVAGDACNKPSSYAGVAKATCDLEQHTDTYLDRTGLEGAVQQLHDSGQLSLSGAFAAARATTEATGAGADAAAVRGADGEGAPQRRQAWRGNPRMRRWRVVGFARCVRSVVALDGGPAWQGLHVGQGAWPLGCPTASCRSKAMSTMCARSCPLCSLQVPGSTKEEPALPLVPRPELNLQQLQQVLPVVHKVHARCAQINWSLDPSAPGYIIKWLVTAEQLKLDALKHAALEGLEKQSGEQIGTQMVANELDADLLRLSPRLMLEAWKVSVIKAACSSCMQWCDYDYDSE
ncbi:hypothetical protein QJQ45_030086, partial [Haematococcus lacustris]